MTKASAGYASLAPLTRWIAYTLYAAIFLSVVGVAFDLNEYRVLAMIRDQTYGSADSMRAAAQLSDRLMALQGSVDFLLQLVLYFVIGRWIFRAAWNARHLGAMAMEITPGWAVGWYFIPFASLVMPFKAMREIWQSSFLAGRTPAAIDSAGRIALLRWWWALFLATCFLGNALLRTAFHADPSIDELLLKNVASTVLDVLSIALNYVFILVIRRIAGAQDRGNAAKVTPEPAIAPAIEPIAQGA
jgi:hypothetical protein